MSTVRTCTTPKEGWGLYGHFLANNLSVISIQKEFMDEESDDELKYKHERIISDAWAQLVGSLYMIMCRMKANGHNEDSNKMRQIISMVVELDITDPEVQEAIHQKHRELDTGKREFEAGLAILKEKYEKKFP